MKIHPIRRIRKQFRKNTDLRCFATQHGFATLIERSESYIRNIETGVVGKLSEKLALAVAGKTGVSVQWLLSPEAFDPELPILDDSGKPWEPAVTIERIQSEIRGNEQAWLDAKDEAKRRGISIPDFFADRVRAAVTSTMDDGDDLLALDLANFLRDHGYLENANCDSNLGQE